MECQILIIFENPNFSKQNKHMFHHRIILLEKNHFNYLDKIGDL